MIIETSLKRLLRNQLLSHFASKLTKITFSKKKWNVDFGINNPPILTLKVSKEKY